VKTTKITATFLAVVLVTGAITFGTSILVDDAFASGDKRDKKKHDRYYDDYYNKYRYYDDYDKKDRYYDDYDKKDRYYDDYDKKDRYYDEDPRY
jgi:hypothetical protein